MDKVTVMTLKGFINEGQYVSFGEVIEVSEMRARDLEANGLVSRSEKKAPEPQNKMQPTPSTKGKAGASGGGAVKPVATKADAKE